MRGPSRESALLNPDFRDILSIFNEERVEYLVIGAYALAAHGNPRATNEAAYPNRTTIELEGVSVPVIGRQDLLLNKKAAGRPQDLADAAWLESEE